MEESSPSCHQPNDRARRAPRFKEIEVIAPSATLEPTSLVILIQDPPTLRAPWQFHCFP